MKRLGRLWLCSAYAVVLAILLLVPRVSSAQVVPPWDFSLSAFLGTASPLDTDLKAFSSHVLADSEYRISQPVIPSEHQKAVEFLELLKWPNEPVGAFDANNAPTWDIPKVLSYISPGGITFSDVNHRMEGHISKERIKDDLTKREGQVFVGFAHLSHIYSIPYKQYSELRFVTFDDGAKVNIGGWYTITFHYEGGKAYVVYWDYEQLEGDQVPSNQSRQLSG